MGVIKGTFHLSPIVYMSRTPRAAAVVSRHKSLALCSDGSDSEESSISCHSDEISVKVPKQAQRRKAIVVLDSEDSSAGEMKEKSVPKGRKVRRTESGSQQTTDTHQKSPQSKTRRVSEISIESKTREYSKARGSTEDALAMVRQLRASGATKLRSTADVVAAVSASSSTSNGADPSDYVEVEELSSTDVALRIEDLVLRTVMQVLNSGSFEFDVPNRGATNQMYVAEEDRVVLGNKMTKRQFLNVAHVRKTAITSRVIQLVHEVLSKGIHITKRDLFCTRHYAVTCLYKQVFRYL